MKLLESSGNFFLPVVVWWSFVCFSVELGDVMSSGMDGDRPVAIFCGPSAFAINLIEILPM